MKFFCTLHINRTREGSSLFSESAASCTKYSSTFAFPIGESKFFPIVVSNLHIDSTLSSVGFSELRRMITHWCMILSGSMFCLKSSPINLIFPNVLLLYFASLSSLSIGSVISKANQQDLQQDLQIYTIYTQDCQESKTKF